MERILDLGSVFGGLVFFSEVALPFSRHRLFFMLTQGKTTNKKCSCSDWPF